MKQALDADQIFERLDQMLRKNERKQQAEGDARHPGGSLPRIVLTEEMRVDRTRYASSHEQSTVSLEHITLDPEEVEQLVAQVHADVNARIDEVVTDWIDEALQRRVLAMVRHTSKDESLSH